MRIWHNFGKMESDLFLRGGLDLCSDKQNTAICPSCRICNSLTYPLQTVICHKLITVFLIQEFIW